MGRCSASYATSHDVTVDIRRGCVEFFQNFRWDRGTDRQTDRRTDRDRQRQIETDRQTDRQTETDYRLLVTEK